MMDFKERVFQARKTKGFSQEELAEFVGVSRQAVSKWETGEAMPDVEKLIALCDALDQNMEYLALGKETAASVEPPRKTHGWVAALLAVGCLVLGFLLGHYLPRTQVQGPEPPDTGISDRTDVDAPGQPGNGVQVQPGSDISDRTDTGERYISNVSVTAAPKKRIDVAVLPAVLTDGLELELLCEDKLSDQSETLSCTFDGNYYRIKLARPEKYHYYITAILTENGEKRQIPLLEIEGDSSHFSTHHIWEQSQ